MITSVGLLGAGVPSATIASRDRGKVPYVVDLDTHDLYMSLTLQERMSNMEVVMRKTVAVKASVAVMLGVLVGILASKGWIYLGVNKSQLCHRCHLLISGNLCLNLVQSTGLLVCR